MRRLLPLLLTIAACVPKRDYDASLAREELLQGQLVEVEGRAATLDADLQRTLAELGAAKERAGELQALTESLENRNRTLQATLDDLSGKVSDLSAAGRQAREQKAELEKLLGTIKADAAGAEADAAEARARIAKLEAEAARLAAEKAQLEKKTAEYDALVSGLKSEIDAGQVTITELSGKLTVQMSNAILFDSGKTDVKDAGRDALVKVAGVLAGVSDREVRVEGHTDNVPVRGGAAYADNWELSALRARTVLTILVENGVAPANIAIVGFADQRPVASNDTPEGKAANRRTEIVLVPRLETRSAP